MCPGTSRPSDAITLSRIKDVLYVALSPKSTGCLPSSMSDCVVNDALQDLTSCVELAGKMT